MIEAGRAYDETAIGRVLSKKRRCGLGTEIVRLGISAAKERMGAEKIRIAAQVYARGLYEKLGFKTEGRRKDFYKNPREDALIMTKRFKYSDENTKH